jgi:hypothetical protein
MNRTEVIQLLYNIADKPVKYQLTVSPGNYGYTLKSAWKRPNEFCVVLVWSDDEDIMRQLGADNIVEESEEPHLSHKKKKWKAHVFRIPDLGYPHEGLFCELEINIYLGLARKSWQDQTN